MKAFSYISSLFSVKYAALALLVLQNTFLVVFMHYSRTKSDGKLYASSTAVAMMEVVKFVSCLVVIGLEKHGIYGLLRALHDEVYRQPLEILKLSVPSLLYTIQNNLLYYALSHLDAATFQVGYQVKIITTAIFSVFMLGKSLSSKQWISLILLTIGVSLAQLSANANKNQEERNTTMGFVAVLLAACTSGFSGVYFESVLKNAGTSLWMRNVQMGVSSILTAFLGVYFTDGTLVQSQGFFFGYNQVVVMVILLQAVGGLIVAVVVKYADNILKGFAASFSIVTSCLLSYVWFDFHPNVEFFVGAILVNVSMYLYADNTNNKKESKFEDDSSPVKLYSSHMNNGNSNSMNNNNNTNNGNRSIDNV